MTLTTPPLVVSEEETRPPVEGTRRSRRVRGSGGPRTLLSAVDWRRPGVRAFFGSTQALLFAAVLVAGAGPIYWMLKGAISPTQELLRDPAALWPATAEWGNLATAWSDLEIGRYLLNTVVLVLGMWLVQIFCSTTAAYALSVLKPRYGPVVYAAILATLFIPGTVSIVALYLTVLDLPVLGLNLVDTPWAVWLPAAPNAFTILLTKRFFDRIPAELYEAAEVDGAGPWTVFTRIILPMSRPVLAVTSLLSIMGGWKEFLWPLIAIPSPENQPLAVALPRLAQTADQSLLVAGLFIATVPPLLAFCVFQRQIVGAVGGFTGVKG